mmetsp:Transcript_89267/g.158330  ORF Transcript_89267/g.158330 Transcript_89267/m.158330 type:complete len:426 (-) Transcript_89267:83-1360(-)
MSDSDDERTEWDQLSSGLIVYFADNVLVMLMATTSGCLGQALFTTLGMGALAVNSLGVVFNFFLTLVLYQFASTKFHSLEDEEEAAEEELKEEKHDSRNLLKVWDEQVLQTEAGQAAIDATKAIQANASSGYAHMLAMLPWIIIVPMNNLPPAFSLMIYKKFEDESNLFKTASWTFIMFMIYLGIEIVTARWYASRPDCGAKCESLGTFLLNSFNHSMLSGAGKSLHLLEVVFYEGLMNEKTDSFQLQAKMAESALLMLGTWFLLVHTWPRLTEETERDKIFKSIITTVTVYSWAFSFVNNLWDLFTVYVPNGQIWYWLLMAVLVLVALVLAKYSEFNFYGGPGRASAGFGLMLCWAVDFGVWWAWAQVMADIDGSVPTGFFPSLLVNSGILIALITVTCLVYIFGDVYTMAHASHHRHKHVVVK